MATYATKLFSFEAGNYTIQYDWKAIGESDYDFLRVALVPASDELTATYSSIEKTSLPSGWTELDGGSKLNLKTSWHNVSKDIYITEAGTYQIVFAWRNDGSGGTNPPAAIDNFSITKHALSAPTDLTASNVTATSATLSWTANSGETSWDIAYGETGFNPDAAGTVVAVSENPYTLTVAPETSYDVYVRAKNDQGESGWSEKVSFTTPVQFPKPTNFALSEVTATTATFGWTAGSNETAWELAFSTSEDFDPNNEGTKVAVSTNPYTLEDLTAEITYYAYLRANYEDGNSAWTDKVTFKPSNSIAIIVNDGTDTNANVPIYGLYADTQGTIGQFIIPAASLASMTNRQITNLTFHSDTESIDFGVAEFDVKLMETENTSYESSTAFDDSDMVTVYSGTVTIADNLMSIDLATPFNYTDGNLMVEFIVTKKGTYKSTSWYGVQGTENTSFYKYNNNPYLSTFGPKVTITSLPAPIEIPVIATTDNYGYTTFSCDQALDLTTENMPEGLEAYKAAVNGTKVNLTKLDQTVPANTGFLLKGTAATEYVLMKASEGTTVEGNDFLATDGTSVITSDETNYIFVMKKNQETLTFSKYVGTAALPVNKAYLVVPAANFDGGNARLSFTFEEGEATGIATAEGASRMNDGAVYNLQGQKVEKAQKGLYIVNGKKVVIK